MKNKTSHRHIGNSKVAETCCIGVFVSVLLSCNLGGYPDLGSKLDTLMSIGQEGAVAWMRTVDDGRSEILVLGELPDAEPARFVFVRMNPNSTGTISAGTYVLQNEQIILSVSSEYNKTLELDVPPSSRTGSTRTDFDPPQEIRYGAKLEGERLHLSSPAGTMVMTDMWDVVSTIDVSTQEGVNMLSRVYNLSTVSLQMRIPGFGGAGLLQYASGPASFVGVVGGNASIEMTAVLSPVAELLFDEYEDYPGIILIGDQVSSTDMAGDGNLSGTMHFSMRDPRAGGDFAVEGDLTYELDLRNGTSSDGGYTITLSTGTVWTVPYQEGENMDFRLILPPR